MSYSPKVAVVIPVYKHSGLLPEAIESVLVQEADFDIHIIIVNDGCPFPGTHYVCMDYSQAYPQRITYLRKRNGGLSSARNFGIRYALGRFGDVEAVYLLDADNRLRPNSLVDAMALMKEGDGCQWVYPNIDMFGLPWAGDYGGDYSLLVHTSTNICEAGSLIHRSVFEAGVFFDEKMKLGFEDWDFFLSAAEKNFVGKNLAEFGFWYRKRPESMLADSHRDEGEIKSSMLRKHKELFAPRNALKLEQSEAPRYAIYLVDKGEVVFTGDPTLGSVERLTLKAFYGRYWAAACSRGKVSCPSFIFVTDSEVLTLLDQSRIVNWSFWKLEEALLHTHLALLLLRCNSSDRYSIAEKINEQGRQLKASIAVMQPHTFFDVMKDSSNLWIDTLISTKCEPTFTVVECSIPFAFADCIHRYESASYDFLSMVHLLKSSPYREAVNYRWGWREDGAPDHARRYHILRKQFNGHPAFPIRLSKQKNIGMLLPLVEFGGVEKVALNIGKYLKSQGYAIHLIVSEVNESAFSKEWRGVFDSLIFIDDKSQSRWDGRRSYFGTDIPPWSSEGNHARALGLMYWLDIVFNCHGSAAHSLMGELKRYGVKTIASLHLNDLTKWGRPTGHTYLSLAYEHSYDLVSTCSFDLAEWCRGMGMPEDKVVPVQNAASFPIPKEVALDGQALRAARRFDSPLHILFLGRLDRQKGISRILQVKAATEEAALPSVWRFVGRAVIDDGADLSMIEISNLVEPPALSPNELMEIYTWADVLLVLSDYEGLPLTILEAMSLGVVVVATDVGAIKEIVEDGKNGFLVSKEESCIDQCLAILMSFRSDPDYLRTISRNAFATAQVKNWDESCKLLGSKISKLLCPT